ncbi:Fructosamine kinase-domain-containing protein [Xylariaceae sp. FL1651]|nr:Fructosamine kinase-domain-containing protein [Xylariaceae sp. FL1651]
MASSTIAIANHAEIIPTIRGNLVLDRAVINAIAKSNEIVSAERYGNSAWSSTARITTMDPDGTTHDYFVKIVKGDLADKRVLGEYNCMSELYKTMPSIVPAPRGFGPCLDSDGYYFICDYLDIDHRSPNPVKLAQKISELHRKSISPTGQFGFHVTPYDGKLPLEAGWESSWVSFYTKLLRGVYNLDTEVNGPWKELDDAMAITLEKVIPRLLGPLEQDGRSVKPCLIHGDLWEENIGTDPRTGEIYIFDSCAYYAHHEMAIGMWRVDHHHMKAKEYRNEYFKLFEPDEPMEEYDDRNRLYAIKERIMYSAHVPGTKARAQALDDMHYLIAKFVDHNEVA